MKLSDYIKQGYMWDHRAGDWSVYSKGSMQHIFHMQGTIDDVIIPYTGNISEMPDHMYKQFYEPQRYSKPKTEDSTPKTEYAKYEASPNSRFTNGVLSLVFLGVSSYFIYQLYPDFGSITVMAIFGGLWIGSACGLFFSIKG